MKGVSGQNSVGNNHAAEFNQAVPAIYHCFSQPSTGQSSVPGGDSAVSSGQPIYIIQQPGANNQPIIINHYETTEPEKKDHGCAGFLLCLKATHCVLLYLHCLTLCFKRK